MSKLRIAKSVYDAILVHGEEAYPHECCGALLGRPSEVGWCIEAAAKARNVCTGLPNTRYNIAPAELVRIERDARVRGLNIAGFYHSHPDHPPHWSPTDLDEAHWIGCSYMITSVTNGRATLTHSFRLAGASEEDKRFEQEEIELVEKVDVSIAEA